MTWQHYSPELTRQLRALGQRNGATLYITLLAAYAMILRRYTGCADLVIGTTYSNRDQWQFESLIGATIQVPALRMDMSDDPDVTMLLGRARAAVNGALTYQDLPLEHMVGDLQLPYQPRWPLFRAVFSFFPETAHDRLQLPGIAVSFLEEFVNPLSRPDLYLVLWERQTEAGAALTGYWMHKQDVFSGVAATEMNQQFQALLANLLS